METKSKIKHIDFINFKHEIYNRTGIIRFKSFNKAYQIYFKNYMAEGEKFVYKKD